MIRCSAVFVLVHAICLGVEPSKADEPQEAGIWSSFTLGGDADGVSMKTTGDTLQLTVPGEYRDLWPNHGKVNSPRVMKMLSGDVVVQVCTDGDIDTAGQNRIEGLPSDTSPVFRAASLILWQDAGNFIRLEHASAGSERTIHYCYYHVFQDGRRVVHENRLFNDQPTQLRLERKDGVVRAAYRQGNDMEWHDLPEHSFVLADGIFAGVSLVNTTTRPFAIDFRAFKIRSLNDDG